MTEADYRKLQPHLEPVWLPRGKELHAAGAPMTHAFFPTNGIITRLNVL